MMQHSHASEWRASMRALNSSGPVATVLLAAALALLIGCQNAPKATETTSAQADSQTTVMTEAELEQTSAHIAQELKKAVAEGTISSRQAGYFEIVDVQRVISEKKLSPRKATDRLRLYQKLIDGLMAGTLSGDDAVKRIGTFNVMATADANDNWVSGIWVRNDAKEDEPSKNLALFASPSGEIALGTLCQYTVTDDGTVNMVFTKPSDGVSQVYTMEMSFSRNAAGDVTMHGKRDGYVEGEGPEETSLPLTPRKSALVSLDDEQWIVGWWTIPVGNRPYALCFFPDGSCTFTDQYGVYKVDGEAATLKMRYGSQTMRELALQQNGTVRLSPKTTPGVKQRKSGITFARKQSDLAEAH